MFYIQTNTVFVCLRYEHRLPQSDLRKPALLSLGCSPQKWANSRIQSKQESRSAVKEEWERFFFFPGFLRPLRSKTLCLRPALSATLTQLPPKYPRRPCVCVCVCVCVFVCLCLPSRAASLSVHWKFTSADVYTLPVDTTNLRTAEPPQNARPRGAGTYQSAGGGGEFV